MNTNLSRTHCLYNSNEIVDFSIFENCANTLKTLNSESYGLDNRPCIFPDHIPDLNLELPDFTSVTAPEFLTSRPESTSISQNDLDTTRIHASQWDGRWKDGLADADWASGSGLCVEVSAAAPKTNCDTNIRRARHAKFTVYDDQLIIQLRESGKAWKEIAKFLPGRSPGALQVRYSTKLKAKVPDRGVDLVRTSAATHFTIKLAFLVQCSRADHDFQSKRIRTALVKYQQQKWEVVAFLVGQGVSPATCQRLAFELRS